VTARPPSGRGAAGAAATAIDRPDVDERAHGVIFGCRRADGRWLMIRRSRHVSLLPLRVCFPGGGVLRGESPGDACTREGLEELGVVVRPRAIVWRHAFVARPMMLLGFLADLGSGPLVSDPREVEEVLWLSRDEALQHPDGLHTNRDFLDALAAATAGPE
jgi:8-oxo-dGTP pyrophosphatase MutT (NUDIX family)